MKIYARAFRCELSSCTIVERMFASNHIYIFLYDTWTLRSARGYKVRINTRQRCGLCSVRGLTCNWSQSLQAYVQLRRKGYTWSNALQMVSCASNVGLLGTSSGADSMFYYIFGIIAYRLIGTLFNFLRNVKSCKVGVWTSGQCNKCVQGLVKGEPP